MAFSFECPHCEMGFEAEFELCGSTCTCPGCGGLFVVPEVDPAALEPAPQSAAGSGNAPVSGPPGTEVFVELARLQEALAAALEQKQALEHTLQTEKEKASRESARSAELTDAKAAQKKADALAKDLAKQLKATQKQLDETEQAAREQTRQQEAAAEQLRKALASALQENDAIIGRREQTEREAEQAANEVARLRSELESATKENERLSGAIAGERDQVARQLAEVRAELAKVELERSGAEESNAGRSGEMARLQALLDAERGQVAANLDKLEKLELALKEKETAQLALKEQILRAETAREQALVSHAQETAKGKEAIAEALAKLGASEKAREKAQTDAKREIETLQKQIADQKRELERAVQTGAEVAKEAERLRAEIAGVKAEKWSAERGFAEEHQRLLDRVQSLEAECETLREGARLAARAAAEPDGETQRLRAELLEAQNAGATAERALASERVRIADKEQALERAREAAERRSKGLLEEVAGLSAQLEQVQKTLADRNAQEPKHKGRSPESEAGLREILARRDLEIQRLGAQLRNASEAAGVESASNPFWGRLNGKASLALSIGGLAIGLIVGAVISRPRSVTVTVANPASGDISKSTFAAPTIAQTAVAEPIPTPVPAPGGEQSGPGPASPPPSANADPAPAVAPGGPAPASRAGMPSHLPEEFLGIRFGTELSEVSGISSWKETAGKRHRKAELLGSEVEAVLTADAQNRLIMGSYVRVAFRQPDALTPFLEWAVNVQDAVSALYGEPIRVHSVENATDAAEVVRKISAGEDYYQATWEREAEDGMIDMSIRVFNERSVVFRMEYRARRLYQAHMDDQAAKEVAKESTPKGNASRETSKDATKDATKEGAAPGSAPGKTE